MARRSDHSREQIRAMALQAAADIVQSEGARALSARKVATAIGYTVGTLYLVFKNQQDMLLHLNALTLEELDHWLEQHAQNEKQHPREQLQALAEAYIQYAVQHNARWNLLFDISVEEGQELPDWYQEKLTRLFERVESALQGLGERDSQDIQRAARVLWASVHGICMLKIRNRLDLAGGQSTEEMAGMLIEYFLQGFQQ